MQMLRDLYVRNAVRETVRNKLTFILGLLAVVLAVFVVAVVDTMYEYMPLFFLSIAEYNVGEIDATIKPGEWTGHNFLNFSRVRSSIRASTAASAGRGGGGLGAGGERGAGGADEWGLYNYSAPRQRFPYTRVWATDACNTSAIDPLNVSERYFGRGSRVGESCASRPWLEDSNCMAKYCGLPKTGDLYVIDTALERRMGLGQRWVLPPVKDGHVYVQEALAEALNVSAGDVIVIMLQLGSLLQVVAGEETLSALGSSWGDLYLSANTVLVPLRVQHVFAESHGKFDQEVASALIVEYEFWFGMVSRAMIQMPAPSRSARALERLARYFENADAYALAQTISFNFPPPRVGAYLSHDYREVSTRVMKFVVRLTAMMGHDKVDVDLTVLRELRELRVVAMFLGLINNIIITALSGLLVLLIYSLLIVSVETRAFDLGVARMVGMTRRGVVQMLLVQTLVQSIPGWVIGLFAADLAAGALLKELAAITKAQLPLHLQPAAIAQASVMGLIVPLVAAILPIRRALGLSLSEALDVSRSRVSIVAVTVYRAGERRLPVPLVCGAVVLSTFGGAIYYLMPLALVSFDLTLLLYIFFGLLVGMLGGLTLLALNIERPLEHAIVYLLLWWLSPATRTILLKNLVAHRARNRKTTIMYALSLAFILFVIVTLSLQIISFEMQELQQMGVQLRLFCPAWAGGRLSHALVDALVASSELVLDAAYVSHTLQTMSGSRNDIKTLGRVFSHRNDVYAVSPNAADVIDARFLAIREQRSGLSWSITEDLYSVRGSQSLILGSLYRSTMGLTMNSSLLLMLSSSRSHFAHIRPLAFLDGMGVFWQSPHPTAQRQDALVSFVTMARLLRQATGVPHYKGTDIPILYVLFKLKAGLSDAQLDEAAKQIETIEVGSGCVLQDYRNRIRGLKSSKEAIQFFAGGTTAVALLICFFSLVSSMIANIHEQSKEIGLLRALGVTKTWIARLYSLEAVVLVLSAGVLGVMIGTLVAFTVTAQRALFTQLPLPFSFPTAPILTIALSSVISAVVAAYVPATHLLRRNIVRLLRSS